MRIQNPSNQPAKTVPSLLLSSILLVPLAGIVEPSAGSLMSSTAMADSEWHRTVPVVNDGEIAELIEGLGSESYATRVRCRQRLSRIGLPAFDALRQARHHPDSEIAIAARKLTSGVEVPWSVSTDSATVQEILSEYGSRSVLARRQRIGQLVALPTMDSFPALVRLTRYEAEPTLSRFAAMALLAQPVRETLALQSEWTTDDATKRGKSPEDDWLGLSAHDRSLMAIHLQQVFANDTEFSGQWMIHYAKELESGRFEADGWSELIDVMESSWEIDVDASGQEVARGKIAPGAIISGDELFRLTWLNAERARVLGQEDDASRFFTQHIDVIPPRTRELTDAALWAIDHKLFDVITAAHAKHRSLFEKSPSLLYASAEALLESEQPELATERTKQALALNPVVNSDDAGEPQLHPVLLENHAEAHLRIAADLIDRGLSDWAQAEYRKLIDELPLHNIESSTARIELAEHLAELLQPAEVVALLQPLVERIEKDDDFRHKLMAHDFDYQSLRSHLDFQAGLDLANRDDKAAASERMQTAFSMDPENIDILIAMYRLDWNDEWKEDVVSKIESVLAEIDEDIEETRQTFRETGNGRPGRQTAIRDMLLANFYNQYAWLVSNTEGDYDKALKRSIESLEMSPGSEALLDTCGRCYFATGDLPAAIVTQRKAVEMTPNSPPLRRQLKMFENAWLDANPGKTLQELPVVELPIATASSQERTDRQRRLGVVPPDGPLSFLDN
ncbi:tetratricopeptide repeat protein [Rhodopirellula bahusiensis]|uniref:tetratricopeptide repeat protein n=3 Tax=Rhodopirellula bahusiensis TaxID=2014065 RepID=UPI003265418B